LEVLLSVEVFPSAVSGCGCFVQAQSGSLSFTVGGILLIDGVTFGLTTQHTLREIAESLKNQDKAVMGRDARRGPKNIAHPIEVSSTQQQPTVVSRTPVAERKRRVIMPSINGRQDDIRSQLDWALIAFDDEEICDIGNTIFVPSHSKSISVSSIVRTDDFEDNDVLVTAGKSGLACGRLRSSAVSMQSQNGVVEARQVILERPLGKIT
jgi:hypothetical protein